MNGDEESIVIIDNGSDTIKAGAAGDEAPTAVLPSIVGRDKNEIGMLGISKKFEFICDEVQQKRDELNLKYPIANGIVTDWDAMSKVWHHTFLSELRITPEEVKGVLVTEAPMNPKQNRERLV